MTAHVDAEALPTTSGPGRLLAFRVLAVVAAVVPLLVVAFVIQSFTAEDEAVHRSHNTNMLWALLGLLSVPLVAAARSPLSAVAPFRVALSVGVAMLAAGALARDLFTGGWFLMPVLLVVLVSLNPARAAVLRLSGPRVVPLLLAAVALVPAVVVALDQARLQRTPTTNPEMLEHIRDHHFSGVAMVLLALAIAAVAAAFTGTGTRLASWLVAGTAAACAVTSLALSDQVGSAPRAWAWLGLAWAVAYAAASEFATRRAAGSG